MKRRRRGKNLNFPTVYAWGLLIFHQSFLHSTSGTCRFKPFQKIVIDITFFLIPRPEDNILDHLSLLSYHPRRPLPTPPLTHLLWMELGCLLKEKQYQNRSTRILVKLMAPESHGPAPVFWIPGCYGHNDSRHHSWWFQHPYWCFTQHTWFTHLSCLLISSELALQSTLVTLMARICHLIFWFISYSPSFLPG